jgi:hypothetical protein
MAMSQAFISYHRAQSKLARLIAHRVAADGHSVWWDRSDRPGDQWSEAVATALANSACVIVIWSRQAVASPVIMGEATAGYGREALVSVLADKTPCPSPFDRAPVIDMHDWEGESADLSWIRLREPLRAKLLAHEREAIDKAPLPPARPQPVRVGFSSAAIAPPPAADYEERRRSPAAAMMTVLALGGLGAAGWIYRDDLRVEAEAWRLALTTPAPAPSVVAPIPAPGPPPLASAQPAPPPLTPVVAAPPEAEKAEAAAPAAAPAPPTSVAAARARDLGPVPQMTITYEQWRDAPTPPSVMRTVPRPPPAADSPRAAALEIPPPPPASVSIAPRAAHFVALRQGQAIDIDSSGKRESDIWFAPDRTGYGLFLGFSNGARARLVSIDKATPAKCEDVVLRRTPIAARELERNVGVCVRSSDGTLSAWRVQRLETAEGAAVLELRPVGG